MTNNYFDSADGGECTGEKFVKLSYEAHKRIKEFTHMWIVLTDG